MVAGLLSLLDHKDFILFLKVFENCLQVFLRFAIKVFFTVEADVGNVKRYPVGMRALALGGVSVAPSQFLLLLHRPSG